MQQREIRGVQALSLCLIPLNLQAKDWPDCPCRINLSGMNIIVNGESQIIEASCTAAQLVEIMGISGGRIAMEVNCEIVPRSTYDVHQFKANDVVEIVHAVGGGW